MTELDNGLSNFIARAQAQLGINYTDEQIEFLHDFRNTIISFSCPGTGKTRAAIGGLLVAELYHQIPGNKIYALSFTNLATIEIKNRHLDSCYKLGVKQTVNFSTLHSICTRILKENFLKLGMNSLTTGQNAPLGVMTEMLVETAKEWNMQLNHKQARDVIKAVQALNSALVFDPENVTTQYEFLSCKITYEAFTRYRKLLYDYNKLTETIQVSDILLYTLELLTRFPEVGIKFKENCKIMLVDEFQDLSLLQLRIISLLTDNLVAIGDIKQQIYGFNGACQEVVEQFYNCYPNAKRYDLTESFRCKDEIAHFATSLILANNVGGEDFKGTGEGGEVIITDKLSIAETIDEISNNFYNHNHTLDRSYLFLVRNNYSVIPIIEALYQRKMPMMAHKYPTANTLPVIKDICATILLAQNPFDIDRGKILNILIPEFQRYRINEDNPLMRVARKEGKSLFEINYKFTDGYTANTVMSMLLDVQEMLQKGEPARKLFMAVWDVYSPYYLRDNAYKLEMEPEYYTRLIAPLIANKTFSTFLKDESDKVTQITNWNMQQIGVRVFTLHAAKGLEADEVYIIDATSDIIPNAGHLRHLEKAGCNVAIAKELRNERSLVYVGCTRAKNKLTIHYTNELSPMFDSVNRFEQYDELYRKNKRVYQDVEHFRSFIKEQ